MILVLPYFAIIRTIAVNTINTEKKIKINLSNGVTIDDNIKVTLADVQGSNGIVHVIDKVIMP